MSPTSESLPCYESNTPYVRVFFLREFRAKYLWAILQGNLTKVSDNLMVFLLMH